MEALEEKRITIGPQAGPQTQLLQSSADIVIYGGSAGGGKTYGLLLDPLREVKNSRYRAAIFRRTMPEIVNENGLLDKARELYPYLGGKIRAGGNRVDCTFPSGARIGFRQLQHEATKFRYQGLAFDWLAFDELTHFTRSQFFYLVTRSRSASSGSTWIRATCNPEPGWVYDFIQWWIDPTTGYAIPERSGVIRYFTLIDGEGEDEQVYIWGDSPEDVIEQVPGLDQKLVLSFTFIRSTLEDNPALTNNDPKYEAKLMLQSKIQRERLRWGNWLIKPGTIINSAWLREYDFNYGYYELNQNGEHHRILAQHCQRFATVDTAGTSVEKVAESRGTRDPSYSVSCVWDWHSKTDTLLLVSVWRDRVEWNGLVSAVPEFLNRNRCKTAVVENAHFGPALSAELRKRGFKVVSASTQIPGMDGGNSNNSKLERAVASGFLTRVEFQGLYIPSREAGLSWVKAFRSELGSWTGLPRETSDQIDNCSHASYYVRKGFSKWGGVV